MSVAVISRWNWYTISCNPRTRTVLQCVAVRVAVSVAVGVAVILRAELVDHDTVH